MGIKSTKSAKCADKTLTIIKQPEEHKLMRGRILCFN